MNNQLYFVIDDSLMKLSGHKNKYSVRVRDSWTKGLSVLDKNGNISLCCYHFKTAREAIQCIKKFYKVNRCKQFC